MKPCNWLFAIVIAWSLALSCSYSIAGDRQIAITIDDLPAGAANLMSAAEIGQMTARLLSPLREQKVPAVGFVNERKVFLKWGEVDDRIKALNMWLDAGFELGNHTYAHTSLNRAGLKDFEESVIQGELVTKLLLAQRKMTLRYFRHPYLDVGRDLQRAVRARRKALSRQFHRGCDAAAIARCRDKNLPCRDGDIRQAVRLCRHQSQSRPVRWALDLAAADRSLLVSDL